MQCACGGKDTIMKSSFLLAYRRGTSSPIARGERERERDSESEREREREVFLMQRKRARERHALTHS